MTIARIMQQAAAGTGGEPEGAWDLSYAYYDPPEGLAWDLGAAVGLTAFSISAQETQPTGLFFKPDGTKMYVTGIAGDDVKEYTLSTPWAVTTASFVQNFSVQTQETNPSGLFFKPDGTKMYIMGSTGDDVNEYDLSTAWDISTASYLRVFSVSSQEANPRGLFFKPDGTKMYVTGTAGDDVNEYNLSTAWNVSTASYLQNFSVSAQTLDPTGVSFKSDGTEMYVFSQTDDIINRYELSIPWDVSSASFAQTEIGFGGNAGVENIFVSSDGLRLYTVGIQATAGAQVDSYILGGFNVGPQEANTTGIFFKPDGTKMYVIGTSGDDVNEYDLSTAWDISAASYLQNFSVSSQEDNPRGLFFKPDGTKMYVTGSTGDDVNEYTLSTPWDISTASYLRVFSVSSQETNPTGLFFKPDGTKMYVIGTIGDDVNEYNLSTPWVVTTASYVQNFSVSAQETTPQAIFFKPDGTKMYVIGTAGDDVNEYDLSTAWDISTASYSQLFNFYGGNPACLFFKDDGTQMFVAFIDTSDAILSYTLGVQP